MLVLVIALGVRNRPATLLGLGLVCLLALSAWPVYEFGQEGFDRVLSMADDPGQAYLRYHAHLAERWVSLYYLTAGVAAVGLLLAWKWPKSLPFSSVLALLLAAGSLLAGIFTAEAGGQIRHREFRYGPPPKGFETSP